MCLICTESALSASLDNSASLNRDCVANRLWTGLQMTVGRQHVKHTVLTAFFSALARWYPMKLQCHTQPSFTGVHAQIVYLCKLVS